MSANLTKQRSAGALTPSGVELEFDWTDSGMFKRYVSVERGPEGIALGMGFSSSPVRYETEVLTPDEARHVAALLVAAADEASA